MMKKILTVFCAVAMIFAFAACERFTAVSGGNAVLSSDGNATYGNASYASYGDARYSSAGNAEAGASALLPNPVVDVTGSDDFAPLGFTISVPDGMEEVTYSIIADTIAQIQFVYAEREYTYRAAKTADDIAGVYETFDPETESIELDAGEFVAEIVISYIDGGFGGALARWSYEDTQYTLYTDDPSDYDSVTDAVLPLVYADLPFPACVG